MNHVLAGQEKKRLHQHERNMYTRTAITKGNHRVTGLVHGAFKTFARPACEPAGASRRPECSGLGRRSAPHHLGGVSDDAAGSSTEPTLWIPAIKSGPQRWRASTDSPPACRHRDVFSCDVQEEKTWWQMLVASATGSMRSASEYWASRRTECH